MGYWPLGPGELDAIADVIWDEVLTAATHNVAASAGRRLRQLASVVVHDGTATAGTSNTITLDAGASATDGAYDPSLIMIMGGTGSGQCRNILEYFGASRTAVVDRDWKVTPNATSEFVIMGDAGREHINEGLATGGGASSITLNALASASNDAYNGQVVFIRSGTGEDQARRVADYDGGTRVATTSRPWSVVPDATSAYVMLPTGAITDECLATAIWDEPTASHIVVGTTGAALGDTDAAVAALNDLSAAQVNAEMVDVLRTDLLPDSYAADGAQPTFAQAVLAILQFLQERAVAGTTVTVYKPDGTTAAMTFTLDNASNPTSITRTL